MKMSLRRSRGKRALITGGAGFIGSHLAEELIADGYAVTALDDLSTGSEENIAHLDKLNLVVGDTADERLVEELVGESDVVFHLAAAVGVKLILAEPIESFRTNVLGTEAVLRAAERHGTKVLIASTSEVYGKVARLPQREDDDVLLGPTSISRWSYAACKMLDEFIGLAYARRGLPVVCFRLFNTVGPRQSGFYGMVIPRFVDAALRGEPLQVHGDGSQSRCFLHVRDAVSAIMKLERAPRAVGEVFNIGSTESVTILELAERVIDTVGTPNGLAATLAGSLNGNGKGNRPQGRIELVPYHEAYPDGDFEDIRARQPSVDKLHAATRWRARHDLDEILRDVVAAKSSALAPRIEEAVVTALA
jgi:nucleoside-diphosphate-sugar epimerase